MPDTGIRVKVSERAFRQFTKKEAFTRWGAGEGLLGFLPGLFEDAGGVVRHDALGQRYPTHPVLVGGPLRVGRSEGDTEKQGLLSGRRSAGGQRHYDEAAVDRVLLIRRFLAVGMNSATIAVLLPHVVPSGQRCPPQVLRRLTTELDRIDAQADELARTRQTLNSMVEATREAMRGA